MHILWYAPIHNVLSVENEFCNEFCNESCDWLINTLYKNIFVIVKAYFINIYHGRWSPPPWNVWSLVTYPTPLLLSVPPYWPATTQQVILVFICSGHRGRQPWLSVSIKLLKICIYKIVLNVMFYCRSFWKINFVSCKSCILVLGQCWNIYRGFRAVMGGLLVSEQWFVVYWVSGY